MIRISLNPNHMNIETTDSVVRAFSIGLNKEYIDVIRELTELYVDKGYHWESTGLIIEYCNKYGLKRNPAPLDENGVRYTIEYFADNIAKSGKIYLIRYNNYMTVIKDKKLYDTFDCSQKKISAYWEL